MITVIVIGVLTATVLVTGILLGLRAAELHLRRRERELARGRHGRGPRPTVRRL